ncbi:unnamed protein product [Owenia fusiformis]|uniref:Uncharacterized protein n=1 Tax=Owenia fusiformis TaxID=6347 RepID=A0A8J1TG65_OWEFU|nr:unnamed protein product [Owenia fusiformis]
MPLLSLTMPQKKRQHVSKERNKKNAILDDSGDEDDFSVTQKIVEFYEGHPYLFDLRHENYRNNKLKEAKLAELATYIKWNVDKIKRRFKNLRSAHGKLKNRAGSSGKSGQSSCRLTSRQEWKIRNLAFLDNVIQPRSMGQEMGRAAGEECYEDDEDTDIELQDNILAPANDNDERGAEDLRLNESANTTGTLDEREAWGNWLPTVVRNCPKEKFKQFQMDTLSLSQRYRPEDEAQLTSSQASQGESHAQQTIMTPEPATSHFSTHANLQNPSERFQNTSNCFQSQPEPLFHYEQQHMPVYNRQPQFRHLITKQHQQSTSPNSAQTPVAKGNIIASSFQLPINDVHNQNLNLVSHTQPGEQMRLPSNEIGARRFGINVTREDQSMLNAPFGNRSSSSIDKADKSFYETESDTS